jgi:hypothetical protein
MPFNNKKAEVVADRLPNIIGYEEPMTGLRAYDRAYDQPMIEPMTSL